MTWWSSTCEGGSWCLHMQIFLIFMEAEELFQGSQGTSIFCFAFFNRCKICNYSQKRKGLLAERQQLEIEKKNKKNNKTTQPCNLCFCSESRNACDLDTALLRKEKLMLSLLSLAFSQPPRGLCYSFNHIRNTGHNWFYKCSQDQKSWILLTLHAGTHPAPQPGVGCWSALWVIPL